MLNPIQLAKWLHIFAALFNLLFIYTPVHDWPYGFTVVQYISTPILVLSGIALVKLRKAKRGFDSIK